MAKSGVGEGLVLANDVLLGECGSGTRSKIAKRIVIEKLEPLKMTCFNRFSL